MTRLVHAHNAHVLMWTQTSDMVGDRQLLALWRGGLDTAQIARKVWMPECRVANRLPRILERARQDAQWDGKAVAQRTAS